VTVTASAFDKWTDDDIRFYAGMGNRLGLAAPDLLLVLFAESALDPAMPSYAKKDDGTPMAVGINQITSTLNKALGLTEAQRLDMLNWSVSKQLPYVEKSLRLSAASRYDMPDAGGIYVANFAPARLHLGFDGNVLLYDQKLHPNQYAANAPADTEKKGWISLENLRQALRKNLGSSKFQAALARYRSVTGDARAVRISPPPIGSTPIMDRPRAAGGGGGGDLGLAAAGVAAAVFFVWVSRR
jgi:hypothetical protein